MCTQLIQRGSISHISHLRGYFMSRRLPDITCTELNVPLLALTNDAHPARRSVYGRVIGSITREAAPTDLLSSSRYATLLPFRRTLTGCSVATEFISLPTVVPRARGGSSATCRPTCIAEAHVHYCPLLRPSAVAPSCPATCPGSSTNGGTSHEAAIIHAWFGRLATPAAHTTPSRSPSPVAHGTNADCY